MNFKLNALVAALVMAVSAPAFAELDKGDVSGNGTLLLNLKWKDTNLSDASGNDSVSAAFDLGVNLNDVAAWNGLAGFSRSWNLTTGVMSGTGIAPTAVGTYSNVFTNFKGALNLDIAQAEMNVFALDGSGVAAPGDFRVLSTTSGINATGTALSLTNASIPTNDNFNQISQNPTVANFFAGLNDTNGHKLNLNGANNATPASGTAYFDNGSGMDKFGGISGFDSTNKFDGTYDPGTGVLSGKAKALPFYMVQSSSSDPFLKANMSLFGIDLDLDGKVEFDNNGIAAGGISEIAIWTLQGDTLTFSAPVPEAETYAMMLAGLGLVGFMVRRRNTI